MTLRLSLLTICAVLELFFPVSGAVAADPARKTEQRSSNRALIRTIDQLVDRSVEEWGTPGLAVAIVKDGGVLFTQGYGVRDPRTEGQVNKETIFPIASLAKAFTSFGVGILVDEGKLSFDGLVKTYVPSFAVDDLVATSEITMRDLLSHRSGLRRRHDFMYYRNPTMRPEEFVKRLSHLDLHARPRQAYEYSNGAYVIVGQAIENATGLPYETFMEERVFKPLGMQRTTFSALEARSDPNHAMGRWFWHGQPIYEYYDFGRIINPHGGINTTAQDMAKWMLANLANSEVDGTQIIKPSTLRQVQTTQIPAVIWSRDEFIPFGSAMGWETVVFRGEMMLHHNGSVPGFHAITMLIPSKNVGLTILANESSELMSLLPLEIMDLLLGARRVDRLGPALIVHRSQQKAQRVAQKDAVIPAAAPPIRPLADYAGSYFHPGYGTLKVRQVKDRLVAEYNGYSAPIVHQKHDVFEGRPIDPLSELFASSLQFRADQGGRITHVTWGIFEMEDFEKRSENGTPRASIRPPTTWKLLKAEEGSSRMRRASWLIVRPRRAEGDRPLPPHSRRMRHTSQVHQLHGQPSALHR